MRTPACLAASRMVVPLETVTGTPSMVSVTVSLGAAVAVMPSPVTMGWPLSCECRRGAPRARDIGFEFAAELLDAAHHRGGARIGKHADSLAGHLVGQVEEQVQVLVGPFPGQDPLQDP